MACIHLKTTELISADGQEPQQKSMCVWSNSFPLIVAALPPWLADWARSGGPTFQPDRDCVGCRHQRDLPE